MESKRFNRVDVPLVGTIPTLTGYLGGIAQLLAAQLGQWRLPVSVAHFNTELWTRNVASKGRLRPGNFLAFFINAIRLSWMVVCRRPAIVHFHSSCGYAALKDMILAFGVRWCTGRKVVFQIHYSVADVILVSRSAFLRRCQLRLLLLCADRIVFLSRNVIRDMAAMLPPKPAAALQAKASLLPNFTQVPSDFARRPQVARPVCIFFIGNVGQRKGAPDLLRAAHGIRDRCSTQFRLVFAGPFDSAEEEQRMRSLVVELGLDGRVAFLGQVSGTAKAEAFLDADVFVLPSYGEGVPIALLEAMMYALPVIVTDVGGIPEIVENDREGIVCHPGDLAALESALGRLVDGPEVRLRMGAAGRARALRSHTLHAFFGELAELYASLGCLPPGRIGRFGPACGNGSQS